MKKELKRVLSIAALVLMVVVCMASCGESAKEEKAVTDKTKIGTTTSVTDNVKSETPNEPGKADQSFIWPVDGFNKSFIENGFGNYKDPVFEMEQFHQGVDINANLGDKVLASADGKVVKAEWYGGYGNCVIIEHKDGIKTLYGHLNEIHVKNAAEVKKGDIIGLAGSTGNSIKPHIQFEVRIKDKNGEYQAVDPEEFLRDLISKNEISKSLLESGYKRTDVKFIWPIVHQENLEISPRYGNMIHPIYGWKEFHSGVDIPTNLGDKVLASSNGKVVKAEFNGDYGLCIVIEHDENIETLYAHLDKMLVKTGDIVKKGDLIGLAGSTGVSTGPHIHFEVKTMDKNREYKTVDPEKFIREQIER